MSQGNQIQGTPHNNFNEQFIQYMTPKPIGNFKQDQLEFKSISSSTSVDSQAKKGLGESSELPGISLDFSSEIPKKRQKKKNIESVNEISKSHEIESSIQVPEEIKDTTTNKPAKLRQKSSKKKADGDTSFTSEARVETTPHEIKSPPEQPSIIQRRSKEQLQINTETPPIGISAGNLTGSALPSSGPGGHMTSGLKINLSNLNSLSYLDSPMYIDSQKILSIRPDIFNSETPLTKSSENIRFDFEEIFGHSFSSPRIQQGEHHLSSPLNWSNAILHPTQHQITDASETKTKENLEESKKEEIKTVNNKRNQSEAKEKSKTKDIEEEEEVETNIYAKKFKKAHRRVRNLIENQVAK